MIGERGGDHEQRQDHQRVETAHACFLQPRRHPQRRAEERPAPAALHQSGTTAQRQPQGTTH